VCFDREHALQGRCDALQRAAAEKEAALAALEEEIDALREADDNHAAGAAAAAVATERDAARAEVAVVRAELAATVAAKDQRIAHLEASKLTQEQVPWASHTSSPPRSVHHCLLHRNPGLHPYLTTRLKSSSLHPPLTRTTSHLLCGQMEKIKQLKEEHKKSREDVKTMKKQLQQLKNAYDALKAAPAAAATAAVAAPAAGGDGGDVATRLEAAQGVVKALKEKLKDCSAQLQVRPSPALFGLYLGPYIGPYLAFI